MKERLRITMAISGDELASLLRDLRQEGHHIPSLAKSEKKACMLYVTHMLRTEKSSLDKIALARRFLLKEVSELGTPTRKRALRV